MKYVVFATILVALALVVASVQSPQQPDTSSELPAAASDPLPAGLKPDSQANLWAEAPLETIESVPVELPASRPSEETLGVINIGPPMDPDDPSTWPQSDDTEVINIGEPMDPDDPSTWPQSYDTEVINIGEPMDPDNPYTWPQSDNTEVINIGEPMDPDDPSTWPT